VGRTNTGRQSRETVGERRGHPSCSEESASFIGGKKKTNPMVSEKRGKDSALKDFLEKDIFAIQKKEKNKRAYYLPPGWSWCPPKDEGKFSGNC